MDAPFAVSFLAETPAAFNLARETREGFVPVCSGLLTAGGSEVVSAL